MPLTQQQIAAVRAAAAKKNKVIATQALSRDYDIAVITDVKNAFFVAGTGRAERQEEADIISIEDPKFFPERLSEYQVCFNAAQVFTPSRLPGLQPDVEIIIYADAQGNGGMIYTRRPWSSANGATQVFATRAQAEAARDAMHAAAEANGETLLPE